MVFGLFGLAVLLSSLFSPAMAQLLPQTELKVVGGLSSLSGIRLLLSDPRVL